MRLSVKNARSGIDGMMPAIALVANTFWIAWIELIYSGEIFIGEHGPSSFDIIFNYTLSTLAMGGTLFVLGLFPKQAQRLVSSGRAVVGAGVLAALVTWLDLLTGNPAFILLTGVFTAVLADRFALVLAETNPKTVMLAQVTSLLLSSMLYGYILYLPAGARVPLMCLLPILAGTCALFTGDLFRVPHDPVEARVTPDVARLVTTLVVFTVALNIVRGLYPSMIEAETFSEVRGVSSVLFFVMELVIAALVVVLPVTVNLSRISYYSLLGLSFFGLVLPLFGLDSSSTLEVFGCINALLNVVMWTLFAGVAYNTGRSSVRVFGMGWGLVSIGSVAAWGLGLELFQLGFGREQLVVVEVALLAAMLLSCTVLTNPSVIDRLFLPVDGDTEEAVEGLAIGGREPAEEPVAVDEGAAVPASSPAPDEASALVEMPAPATGPSGEEKAPDGAGRSRGKWSRAVLDMALDKGLSTRETDVLFLLLKGNTKQMVSEKLCVSYNTVRSHVRNIYSKCDTHSQQELVGLFETYLER